MAGRRPYDARVPAPQVIRSIVARRGADRTDAGGSSARHVLVRIVLLVIAIRVVLYVIGVATQWLLGDPDPFARSLSMWNRWDAPHYLRLADVGYRPRGEDRFFIVFYPGYPLAVRLASVVFRDLVLSALVVSAAASTGAAWLLYKLVRLDHDHPTAWRAVVVLFAFPTAYYLAVPYTESLFLLAVVGSVYAARTGRWPAAGLAGLTATATRVAGLALLPALAVEALRRPRSAVLRKLSWCALAVVGALAYLTINWVVFGDPVHFLGVQRRHWSQQLVWPWEPTVEAARQLLTKSPRDEFRLIYAGRLAAAVFGVAVLLWGRRRLRPTDQVYGWIGLALVMSPSWLISLPRYLLGIYPLFIVLAVRVRNRALLAQVVIVSCAAQAYFFSLYARGAWTF